MNLPFIVILALVAGIQQRRVFAAKGLFSRDRRRVAGFL
jgi:hypothetical protein